MRKVFVERDTRSGSLFTNRWWPRGEKFARNVKTSHLELTDEVSVGSKSFFVRVTIDCGLSKQSLPARFHHAEYVGYFTCFWWCSWSCRSCWMSTLHGAGSGPAQTVRKAWWCLVSRSTTSCPINWYTSIRRLSR